MGIKINYSKYKVAKKVKIRLYEQMLWPRMIEEKMLVLIRQGKISKWFSGIGQEAIAVGCTSILRDEEVIFPMHRNLGVFTTRGISLFRLFCQWQGKPDGFTNGRDRSFHFGSMEHNVVGMISHLGPQLSLADGVALSHKLRNEKNLTLAFTGEGGTSEGEFHEALNVASVWQLPVIFAIENNGYGLSTPTSEQYACKNLVDRAKGYGMKSLLLDGNNILEVYTQLSDIAKQIRKKPEPILIEFKTFRMRGHEEASGTKYVPKKLMNAWAKKDPVTNFEKHLLKQKVVDQKFIDNLKATYKKKINQEVEKAFDADIISADVETELGDIYSGYGITVTSPSSTATSNKRFIDAIKDGLDIAMAQNDDLVIMGQDIAEYGGVFKITEGFVEKYGRGRVRNTPICESAIVGAAIGLSLKGIKSVMEMQFSDFATCGFTQIVNNMAKLNYRWGQNVDVVIRMPCGGGVGAGPFHSQTNEAWFAHTPGLKVVYPSNPHDAKGLLLASIEDPNPVIFFEHKGLYRSQEAEIPDDYYTLALGEASLVVEGDEMSIITYGMGVQWALQALEGTGVAMDIVDLRTLNPLDYEAINSTVKKTGKVIILHEDTLFGGYGAEIASYISEHLFEYLDAPPIRVASMDTPVPFNRDLEKQFLPVDRLIEQINYLHAY